MSRVVRDAMSSVKRQSFCPSSHGDDLPLTGADEVIE